jgi:hypothetical protein
MPPADRITSERVRGYLNELSKTMRLTSIRESEGTTKALATGF